MIDQQRVERIRQAADSDLVAASAFIDDIIGRYFENPRSTQENRRWIVSGIEAFAVHLLQKAQAHLHRRFEAELTGKRQRITTEQAALAMLKGASLELETAGKALDAAAEQLRDAGQGKQASQAKQAASKAKAAAGELVPS